MFSNAGLSLVSWIALGFLFGGAVPASAGADPIPAEAIEQARVLIKSASLSGERHAAQALVRRRAAPVGNADGFQKFLKLKNVCLDKNSNGLVILEGSRGTGGGKVFDMLLSNFKLWDSGEAPVYKVANECLGAGDYCSSSIWCCGAMMCSGGVCGGSNGNCIPRGRPCGGTIWCCGTGICNEQGYCQ